MTYSDVLAANFERGTWIIYDSKLLNLENLEVENDTSNAILHILGNLHPRQPVDPNLSTYRGRGTLGQRSCGAACLDNQYRSREIQKPGRERRS